MEPEKIKSNPTDYLANERTFLAWVRTSIGIMAFGFVVVKFSLFVKQLSLMLDLQTSEAVASGKVPEEYAHHSPTIGILLVVLGLFVLIMAYIRYRFTIKQLATGRYAHSSLNITILTAVIFLISMLLVYYLINA